MNTNKHKPRRWVLPASVLAALVLGAAGGAWWGGRHMGGGMPGGAAAPLAAMPADPDAWSIAQGEEATRRHQREGLKAGDIDPATGRRILHYHDPMVPGRNFDAPGKSPFMDMMLVPRYAGGGGGEAADAGSVAVSPRVAQNLGLRTAQAERRRLTPRVDAVGAVAWNERDQVLLQARAAGFVERLHVRALLDRVQAGAPLAEIYVPAWVAAQEEYLALARMDGPGLEPLRDAARQRMRLAGMDEAQIEAVVRERRVAPRAVLRAPQAGVLSELAVREGATVMAGQTLLRIQGTARVWVEGEVPETQAARLRPGARVQASSPALPGRNLSGRVQALLPGVDPATRTIKARLELANLDGRLVPGMTVHLRLDEPGETVLAVPSEAVIETGRRSVVMLAEDGGRYRPLTVRTGAEHDGWTEIREGLQPGQRVVLSGQFLIDSEASLRGLEARLQGAETAAAAPAPASSPAHASHRTPATVEALDGDTITLTHPPIPALKWPQMRMDFQLAPGALAGARPAPGQAVEVEFRLQDGELPLVTRLRPAGGAR